MERRPSNVSHGVGFYLVFFVLFIDCLLCRMLRTECSFLSELRVCFSNLLLDNVNSS